MPSDKVISTYKKISGRVIRLKGRLISLKNKFKRTSYSQSGEDLIIRFIFNRIGIAKPSYLDIGAHHPFYLSNSALFYDMGGRGINVEPDPNLFKLFLNYRKKDTNLNYGVGDKEGQMELNIMNVPAMNTFSKEEADRLVKENGFKVINKSVVQIQTIEAILKKYNNGIFPDLLSIDVEGLDEDIIKSINFSGSKPTVICLETISYSENGRGQKNHDIINYIKNKGYLLYADTNINTIFVLQEKWQTQ
jgi:FkbM family methyltransferase